MEYGELKVDQAPQLVGLKVPSPKDCGDLGSRQGEEKPTGSKFEVVQ